MADYLYSVAIQANLFHNNIADKTVWRVNWGWINEYALYCVYEYNTLYQVCTYVLCVCMVGLVYVG